MPRSAFIAATAYALLLAAVPSHAEKYALRTADGALFLLTWPGGGCTVETRARNVRPTHDPSVFWLDDRLLQLSLNRQDHFCGPAAPCPDTSAVGILKAHRAWELEHWRSALQADALSLVDSAVVAAGGGAWLFWSFAMPQSDADDNVERQLMLSTRVGERVLVLGTPLQRADAAAAARAYLESAAATLQVRHGLIDIAALQGPLRGRAHTAMPAAPAAGAAVQLEECGLQFRLPSAQWSFREKMQRGPLAMHLYSRAAIRDSRDRPVQPGITIVCERARPEWTVADYSAIIRQRVQAQGVVERLLTRGNSGLALDDAVGYQVRWVDQQGNEHISYVVHALAAGLGIQFIADTTTELYETLRPEWEATLRTLALVKLKWGN